MLARCPRVERKYSWTTDLASSRVASRPTVAALWLAIFFRSASKSDMSEDHSAESLASEATTYWRFVGVFFPAVLFTTFLAVRFPFVVFFATRFVGLERRVREAPGSLDPLGKPCATRL